MPKFLLNLSDQEMERLKEKSEQTGAPMSYFVRQGLKVVLGCDAFVHQSMVSGQMTTGTFILNR